MKKVIRPERFWGSRGSLEMIAIKTRMLINLDARKSWNIPLLSSSFLSRDRSLLVGISVNGEAIRISTLDGHDEILCGGGAERKALFLKDHDNDSVIMGFYDSHGQVQVDIKSLNCACLNIARVPIENLKDVS